MIKYGIISILVLIVAFAIHFTWITLLIANGYASKYVCSSIFLSNRTLEDLNEDLNIALVKYATLNVNHEERSVTSSIYGLGKAKAIYREGLGATLVNDITEEELLNRTYFTLNSSNDNQDQIPWPMGDHIDDAEFPVHINKMKLEDTINSLFLEHDPKQCINTRAVLIVHDGKLIGEKYAPGFSRKSRFLGWSMTKSIINALIGILVKDNQLNIDDPASVPEWEDSNDPRNKITIRHLLQQKSGIDFNEHYYGKSDVTEMLYLHSDMAACAASRPLKFKPGTHAYYSSGNTNILSRLIRHVVGDNEYQMFPHKRLFSKLGIHSLVMEVDGTGTFVGSSYGWGTARDWARFGLLYLNKGYYNDQQIITEQWINDSVSYAGSNQHGQHGMHFWLNTKSFDDSYKQKYPNAPEDMFWASGFNGQHVFIIPSEKLVVVRFGLTRTKGENYGANEFLEKVIQVIKSK